MEEKNVANLFTMRNLLCWKHHRELGKKIRKILNRVLASRQHAITVLTRVVRIFVYYVPSWCVVECRSITGGKGRWVGRGEGRGMLLSAHLTLGTLRAKWSIIVQRGISDGLRKCILTLKSTHGPKTQMRIGFLSSKFQSRLSGILILLASIKDGCA